MKWLNFYYFFKNFVQANCDFDNFDMCSWSNYELYDSFDWEIATAGSDAQILAPWRDADKSIYGNSHVSLLLLIYSISINLKENYTKVKIFRENILN